MSVFGQAVLVICGVASLFFVAMLGLAKRAKVLRNAATPYECGFDPVSSARTPFSLRFFLLGILFLIFDVEVAVLFPLVFVVGEGEVVAGVGGALFFLLVLLGGLLHEWREGSLDWVR